MNAISDNNKMSPDLQFRSAPALYHKMLDYRVTEILMGALAIGAVVLFRLHR